MQEREFSKNFDDLIAHFSAIRMQSFTASHGSRMRRLPYEELNARCPFENTRRSAIQMQPSPTANSIFTSASETDIRQKTIQNWLLFQPASGFCARQVYLHLILYASVMFLRTT